MKHFYASEFLNDSDNLISVSNPRNKANRWHNCVAADITNNHRQHSRLIFHICCWLREHTALHFICVFPSWTLLIWESFVSVLMEVRVCMWLCVLVGEKQRSTIHWAGGVNYGGAHWSYHVLSQRLQCKPCRCFCEAAWEQPLPGVSSGTHCGLVKLFTSKHLQSIFAVWYQFTSTNAAVRSPLYSISVISQ